jgi:lysophospholipase L1-like esterase
VLPAETGTGGYIGSSASPGYSWAGAFYFQAKYPTPHSTSVQQSMKNQLYSAFQVLTTATDRIVWDGDSITVGFGGTDIRNITFYADPLLSKRAYFRNIGITGQGLSQCLTNESGNITATFDPTLTNIVVQNAGTNDLAAGTTGTNLFNNSLVPYVAAAKAAGYKVVIGTLLYRTGQVSSFETERQTYNNLVRSNAVADGYTVVDYDSVVQLQNPQTAGYSSDGTHPTSLGYSVLAPVAAAAINPLL